MWIACSGKSRALKVEAAVSGMGLAYVPECYARQWLASGQLTRLLGDWEVSSQGIALYFPQNRHMPVALRLFIDTIKATLRVQN
ncbi:LysR substrate-binding domain-containing protein [Mangrovibacter yixingensis]|uniref:LysR substrate-binding domain-containing protein n=1 Tax=Mangrovibacter yixingensis TaxID=1529639 RepID=UPI001CFB1D5C|nr:LysR substrate-binding domain-containing protein [Mangrovibacter yixingensis]